VSSLLARLGEHTGQRLAWQDRVEPFDEPQDQDGDDDPDQDDEGSVVDDSSFRPGKTVA
jgi:hypothetical protein